MQLLSTDCSYYLLLLPSLLFIFCHRLDCASIPQETDDKDASSSSLFSKISNVFNENDSDDNVTGSDKAIVTSLTSGRVPLRKRHVLKSLGEKCSITHKCTSPFVCIQGQCSCAYEHYEYTPPSQKHTECRKRIKYGHTCELTEDCKISDGNTACIDSICRCINGTHYIGSRTVLMNDRRCHRILERKGDKCEIDEQCSRLADNHHRCHCVGICECTSIDHYAGCSICHENIKRTFFGGAAFIVLLLTSRLFTKMRHSTSPQDRGTATSSATFRNGGQMLNSNTVPAVAATETSLRNNRRVALSLPNVFLIDRQNIGNIPSSQTAHFLPHPDAAAGHPNGATGETGDAPPSYDDIVESDRLVWSEPPPAYEEVALKCMQPRKP